MNESQNNGNNNGTPQVNPLVKLLSGRFILTIVSAICFLIFSKTVCEILIIKQEELKISDVNAIISNLLLVISNIVTFYFVRKSISSNGSSEE